MSNFITNHTFISKLQNVNPKANVTASDYFGCDTVLFTPVIKFFKKGKSLEDSEFYSEVEEYFSNEEGILESDIIFITHNLDKREFVTVEEFVKELQSYPLESLVIRSEYAGGDDMVFSPALTFCKQNSKGNLPVEDYTYFVDKGNKFICDTVYLGWSR